MPPQEALGSFEHLVLLGVMQLKEEARALDLRELLEREAERNVSRGALYATLERLERKGFLDWSTELATPARGGIPKRVFRVTPAGVEALRLSHRVLSRLTEGLEGALG